MCVSRQYRCVHARSVVYVRSGHPFITRITGVLFDTDFKPIIMAEDDACLVVFAKKGQLPKDLLNAVFAFLVVDPQTICTIQRTCCTTRRWPRRFGPDPCPLDEWTITELEERFEFLDNLVGENSEAEAPFSQINMWVLPLGKSWWTVLQKYFSRWKKI